jgi:cytochrome c2
MMTGQRERSPAGQRDAQTCISTAGQQAVKGTLMNMQRAAVAVAAIVGATLAANTALAADANAGKKTFRAQCALCHSAEPNDNGGAQGPNLSGVIGRPAASAADFTYTKALKNSHLKWDAATLDRFLSSPTTVVPGSAMVIALPKKEDRDNVIAYFTALKEGTFKEEAPERRGPPPGMAPSANAGASKGTADWKNDKPGRVHKIDVANLPPPFDTPSAANFPRLVDKPADAKLALPPGFKVAVFAKDMTGPRAMRVAPNGDIFITETQAGRVKVMRPSSDGATAASVTTFAQGLLQPFGIRFYPET